MITGDDEGSAHNAAKNTKIDNYLSRALPEDKFKYIEEQKQLGHKVIMIGDGINDAPALAAADTGIMEIKTVVEEKKDKCKIKPLK